MKATFILEGRLNENDQYQLSKDFEQLAKDWGLSSYLDDVIEDEQEDYSGTSADDENPKNLKGAILQNLLPEIRNLLIDFNLS